MLEQISVVFFLEQVGAAYDTSISLIHSQTVQMFLKSLGLLLMQLNFPVLDEFSHDAEGKDRVCGDDAICDAWGPRGPHSLSA